MESVKYFIELVGETSEYNRVMLEDYYLTLSDEEKHRYIDKLKNDKTFNIYDDYFYMRFVEMCELNIVMKDYS